MKFRIFVFLIAVAFVRMLAAGTCDVLVVGGGAAGIAAALQAGRSGASVVLLERGFQVGGNMTTGGVNFPGLFHAWGRQVIDGCAYEVLTNAVVLSGEKLPDFAKAQKRHWMHQLHMDIPVFVALAEEALCKAGVRICYHTAPMKAVRSGNVWKVMVVADGRTEEVDAAVLVDCTGDGTLAAMAGARRMRDEETSPGSFMYTFANGEELWGHCDKKVLETAFRKALEKGDIRECDASFGLAGIFEHVRGTSWNYVPGADTSTAGKRTDANLQARASMLRVYRFLKGQPGFERLRLGTVSPEVGVRETWRVVGDYVMTVDDYVSGRVFEDAVCHAFYPVDLHSVSDGVSPKQLKPGVVPSVPFRALCVKGVKNLLVAGRCVSGDRLAVSGLRVQAACMATGQVAGEAAALAARLKCDVRELPLPELRTRLATSGAIVSVGACADRACKLTFSNGTVGTYQYPVVMGDFGKDAFGWLEARTATPCECVFRMGEKLNPDGTVNICPGGTIRACEVRCEVGRDWTRVPLVADERNTKGVNGKAIAVVLPEEVGVVMPFRYVRQMKGPEGVSLRRVMVHWPMSANVICPVNDPDVKKVWDFCQYSVIATSFAGIMVDGDRERIPYEGDIYINMLGQLYGVDGDPELSRRSIRHVLKHPTWPTEWKQHTIMCVWEDWNFTKSTALVAECYDLLRREKLMLERARPDGLLPSSESDIVDWPIGERDGYDMKTPCNAVVNAFHYRNLREMADMAKALGKEGESLAFNTRAEKVMHRFNEIFYDSKSGLYVDGEGSVHVSLHANVAALDFGLVPMGRRAAVIEFIANRGMVCSPYFAQYYLEALCKHGRKDVALRLMTAHDDRSWLGMIEQGASMTMEAWNQNAKPNQDWNHAWGTAPLNIIARFFKE